MSRWGGGCDGGVIGQGGIETGRPVGGHRHKCTLETVGDCGGAWWRSSAMSGSEYLRRLLS